MTWTYTTDPAVDRDFVRELLGDTTESDTSPTDEQITYWLAFFDGDKYRAAAKLARLWSAKLGNLAAISSTEGTVKIGGMSLDGGTLSYRQGADFYIDLAAKLDAQATNTTGKTVGPSYVPTISRFSIGMMDNL